MQSATDLDEPPGSLDEIFWAGSYHHVPGRALRIETLRRIARAPRPRLLRARPSLTPRRTSRNPAVMSEEPSEAEVTSELREIRADMRAHFRWTVTTMVALFGLAVPVWMWFLSLIVKMR